MHLESLAMCHLMPKKVGDPGGFTCDNRGDGGLVLIKGFFIKFMNTLVLIWSLSLFLNTKVFFLVFVSFVCWID